MRNLPQVNIERLKNRHQMKNTEIACLLLGWQGGTIHQVSEETGLSVEQILQTENIESLLEYCVTNVGDLRKFSTNQIARALCKYCDPEVSKIAAWWILHKENPKNWSKYLNTSKEEPEIFIGIRIVTSILKNYDQNNASGGTQSLLEA